MTGLNLYIKHENHQPVGAFNVRGGLNLAAEVAFHGAEFDEASVWITAVAEKSNGTFVGSTEDPLIGGGAI